MCDRDDEPYIPNQYTVSLPAAKWRELTLGVPRTDRDPLLQERERMTDSIQFSVTRLNINLYRVVVQDEKVIIRTADVAVYDIMDRLGFELEQLKSRNE